MSLVELPCDHAENNLQILSDQPPDGVKKRFCVCSKYFTFKDKNFIARFIEWVHMVNILGAEKIHFFVKYVHPDMQKVINYFEEQGMMETWNFLEPTGVTDTSDHVWQAYQLEVNTLTDCFYRVKNFYDFVGIMDFDEVIMPVVSEDFTWEDIISRANESEYKDYYVSQNVYYPNKGAPSIPNIPTYMYMLQHVERSQNFSKNGCAVKSLFGTERVLAIHNHAAHYCIAPTGHRCFSHQFKKNSSSEQSLPCLSRKS